MRRFAFLPLACVFFSTVALSAEEAPAPKFPDNFSANVKMKTMGQENRVRFHKMGPKTRMEMDLQGVRSVTIIDAETQTMTNLKPQEQIALQLTNPAISQDPMSELAKGNMTLTKVEAEKVNGVEATKYVTETDFGQSIYVWLDDKQQPVRLATPDGLVQMDFSKVKLDPPNASLFEIPEGYKIQKLDLPGMGGTPAPASPSAPAKEPAPSAPAAPAESTAPAETPASTPSDLLPPQAP